MKDVLYCETWSVLSNSVESVLDIVYSKAMCPTPDKVDNFRLAMADEHKCQLKCLLSIRLIGDDAVCCIK